jgi:quercetin dioxygenase-like cupin family protein
MLLGRHWNWQIALFGAVVFGAGVSIGTAGSLHRQTMGDEVETYRSPSSGTTIRLLLDERNLGSNEVEIGEITFPPGANSGGHVHGSTEIFYVLSGELEHVVNGNSHLLKPGMIGFVRPPDSVNHIVHGNEPVRALVIWVPGGEAQRILSHWIREP